MDRLHIGKVIRGFEIVSHKQTQADGHGRMTSLQAIRRKRTASSRHHLQHVHVPLTGGRSDTGPPAGCPGQPVTPPERQRHLTPGQGQTPDSGCLVWSSAALFEIRREEGSQLDLSGGQTETIFCNVLSSPVKRSETYLVCPELTPTDVSCTNTQLLQEKQRCCTNQSSQ